MSTYTNANEKIQSHKVSDQWYTTDQVDGKNIESTTSKSSSIIRVTGLNSNKLGFSLYKTIPSLSYSGYVFVKYM